MQVQEYRLPIRCGTEMLAAARLQRNAAQHSEKRKGNFGYYGVGSDEEEIEDTLGRNAGALVTRNHYGCLVLNAAHALFIDVDLFVPGALYDPLEGRANRMRPVRQQMLEDLSTVLQNQGQYGFRIYRTAGGFRILATTHEFEPGSGPAELLMAAVGADKDFTKLCRQQRNFRARLTPKPWRCGLRRPPNSFPRKTAPAEQQFQNWLAKYEPVCGSRATCEYVGSVGREMVHDRLGPIVEFHDRVTKASSHLPLA